MRRQILAANRNFLAMLAIITMVSGGLFFFVIKEARAHSSIEIGETTFVGTLFPDKSVAAFKGLQFAKPPIGDRRWQAAAPSELPRGHYNATRFKPACYQGDHITNWYRQKIVSFGGDPLQFLKPEVSEDCLYLNLWKPTNAGEQLPVIVFVHGGSNRGGWSYEPDYEGIELATYGAIVVTIAYRLGVFGFFTHPDLSLSNFALTDIVAALDWLQRHVAAFGGDPHNITLMGESSGGNNILHLLSSPIAKNRFQRAIVQSAGWAVSGRTNRFKQLQLASELTEELSPSVKGLSGLRAISAEEILKASEEVFANHFFDVVVDGTTLVEPTGQSMRYGRLGPVDLLIGSNLDEWRSYLPATANIENTEDLRLSQPGWKKVQDHFASSDDPLGALDQLVTASNYVCPSKAVADSLQQKRQKVWRYLFTKHRDGDVSYAEGAYHGAELPYVFNTHAKWLPTNVEDRLLSKRMMSYWISFARNGDPNVEGEHVWPAHIAQIHTSRELYRESEVLVLGSKLYASHHPSDPLCRVDGIAPEFD